jgi:hypothetical protein
MAQAIDIDAACLQFAQSHDPDSDVPSGPELDGCPHFDLWAQDLLSTGHLTDEDRAFLALQSRQPTLQMERALALLARADVPSVWIAALEAVTTTDERKWVEKAAVHALYGLLGSRMSTPVASRDEAVALAHLSELEGGVSIVEALSSVTPPDRLAEMQKRQSWSCAAANPRLPASVVNEAVTDDWSLVFHPNVDAERAWPIILEDLESGGGELEQWTRPFDNMRDDGWIAFADFPRGASAELLRQRIAEWCREHMDEEGSQELLDSLGIEAEEEDEE